ncbi:uncharacterized protein N7446_001610 [Penicillium canescens]|uniref:Rhodopsin domain-containing protein n=1 Tax=Penicillium canescens TaxID=5083 RepID=A0AAD6ICN3_PENCN|nr:uncharacterized protein N7446_001610 [Penicillium canescens]KAJ6043411.1 hypothetical protein N7460_004766 [Penicillium canescens]KAJ6054888.1 hypothetical protein N7444_003986 [Penicillium canescens]KAJ6073833.1 hypothetical protein N7446_001610 [Penicillium canescens]
MDSTLIILWVFTWVAIGLIVLRLLLRKVKGLTFVLGDYFAMGAILCALVRLALVHVILIWGTNNMSTTFRHTHHFTPEEIRRREIASKFVLTNRVFYNSYLWLQKLVLLDTYRRLLRHLRWEKATMISYIGIFAATYVTVQIVTFTECDPFNHYWIVLPDPGICCQAQLQLIVLGVLNVITDLMLIALPIPILILVKRSTVEKLQLAVLFAVGLFIVAITIARLPQNAKNPTAQVNRTTWASIELLAAAIVANAPVLYGLLKGQKERSKYAASGAGSTGPSSQGFQKRSANEPEFELQGTRHSKRGSALGSKISTRTYLEIDGESSQSLTRSLEK